MSQSLSPGGPRVEDIVHGHPPPETRGDHHDQLVTTAQVHSASYSVGAPPEAHSLMSVAGHRGPVARPITSSASEARHGPSNIRSEEGGDTWSHAMEYEDEFAWSVQQFDNSVESAVVGDGRLSQDYDDIDYTSGNMVSFHTSLAR